MGFKATEAVEELSYDFAPYGPAGTIPEPTTKQVEAFRATMFGSLRSLMEGLGIKPEDLDKTKVTLDLLDTVMEKSSEAEDMVVHAVADLTGIADHTLNALPYRIKAAFLGYITGQFLNPEA